MLWLKGCSRCGGDLLFDRSDKVCLQCGHRPLTEAEKQFFEAMHGSYDPRTEGRVRLVRGGGVYGALKQGEKLSRR